MAAAKDMGRAAAVKPAAAVDEWFREADVLVVGFGAAGACAAIGAREVGAEVLVLERASGGGGTSATDARERAMRLANAADRAIQATLSEDSARFLAQSRQEGGE